MTIKIKYDQDGISYPLGKVRHVDKAAHQDVQIPLCRKCNQGMQLIHEVRYMRPGSPHDMFKEVQMDFECKNGCRVGWFRKQINRITIRQSHYG